MSLTDHQTNDQDNSERDAVPEILLDEGILCNKN